MWQLIAVVLASASLQASQPVTVKGTAFGPRERLICEWFTNFENNRFEQCHITGGTDPLLDDGASIECVGQRCEELDAAARKTVRWKKPEPVWGTFTVEILGRVSTARHEKRYLGDATRTVLIEKLVSIRKR